MLAHVEKGGSFREVQLNNSGDSDGIPIGLRQEKVHHEQQQRQEQEWGVKLILPMPAFWEHLVQQPLP